MTILMVVVLSLAVLYYLDNLGSLSTISFTEVIFEDVEELKFLEIRYNKLRKIRK